MSACPGFVILRYFILLTCQMHTDYTVSAHDISIFEKCSLVFARCTDNNRQLDVIIVLQSTQRGQPPKLSAHLGDS